MCVVPTQARAFVHVARKGCAFALCMLLENKVVLNQFHFLLIKKSVSGDNACNRQWIAVCSTEITNFFQSTIKMSIKFKMVELRRCTPSLPPLPLGSAPALTNA